MSEPGQRQADYNDREQRDANYRLFSDRRERFGIPGPLTLEDVEIAMELQKALDEGVPLHEIEDKLDAEENES